MSAFTLLTSEQECQTVLQCTPHILAEDGTALVQSANMCQTEITIDPADADVDLQSILGYLSSEKITHDAVHQVKPYRKIKIKFILPKTSAAQIDQTTINPEPSKTDVTSDDDVSDLSVTDVQKFKEEEVEVAKIYPILKKTVGRTLPTESINCQTTLFVYPHFLNDNETGKVTAETSIQTAFTFTPQCSLSNILPKLKSYLHHDGRVIDCGDGFKRTNVIDFIRELLGDIVNMHENLFDPNCILPELPVNLALDVGKSTYTNTETNSSSTATNTRKSLELISASTSPSPSIESINESKSEKKSITETEQNSSTISKYLSALSTRPTCDCCSYSPCCSDIQINIVIDRQPFDKCCSKTDENQQVDIYFPQHPVNSIIEELLEEIIDNITKSVPNMEKQLIPIGNTDYSQQFDFNSMHDPQSLQIVPYVPSMLEEVVKEKMKNMDPFKFCTEVGTQCDCSKDEEQITKLTPTQRKKLLTLPSTSTEPNLEFGLVTPTISNDPNAVLSKKLAVSLGSKVADKLPNKIHICKCPKDKPTVGCFCCSKNIDIAAEEVVTTCSTLKSIETQNPYLDIEDKAIQTPFLKAVEYNIQKEEEPKMSDTNVEVSKTSMVEMYKRSQYSPVHQSVQIDFGTEQGLSVKPSKTVTILDNAVSEFNIPLKRTRETINLPNSEPQNNRFLEKHMEVLRIELTDDTDEETDDDYTTATSSPTNVKNPENVDENDPERKASREEMMKLLLDLKIIDSSANQHQLETLTKQKQTKSDVSNKSSSVCNKSNIASTKSICKNSERKKNFLNLCRMTDTCSAMSSAKSLQFCFGPQPSQMIAIITQGLKSDYPSTQALCFSKEISAPLSIISKKGILSTEQSTIANNVQFILLNDDDTDSPKTYQKCLPNCSEHIIATKCLECPKGKNIESERICAATGLPKPTLKVCAATENLKPPAKTVSLNSNTTSKTLSAQERVISAVKICESQLQPLRDAFIDLKQKLKQLNIPEVNCIFETNEIDSLNSNKFRIRVATNPDPSKCGFHTTSTKIKLVPPTKPSSSHANINSCSSRVSSRQSCRSVRNPQCYLPNNHPSVTARCQSASQDWKRYYSCLLHYDENAPCLRRPTSTQDNSSKCGNKGFQTSNSSSYCSLNVARTEDDFECSNNASQYDFSHVSSEEFQECPYRNNNYYPGNYMNGGPRHNYY